MVMQILVYTQTLLILTIYRIIVQLFLRVGIQNHQKYKLNIQQILNYTMNFHYQNNPYTESLLRELKEIETDLESKQKLLAKRKLQQQFYEDQYTKVSPNYQPNSNKQAVKYSANQDLADEVMKELLMGNESMPAKSPIPQKKIQNYYPKPQKPNFNPTYEPTLPQRRNPQMIQNKRELEKQKLQNQNMMDDYPFGKYSGSKERKKIVYSPPKQPIQQPLEQPLEQPIKQPTQQPQRDPPHRNPPYNPFTRDEQFLKKRREENERNYRRLLQEQMAQQKRKKNQQKQSYRNQIAHIESKPQPQNNYYHKVQQQPFVHKRRDPNGSPPKYQQMVRNNSTEDYMKMQVADLTQKLKKGRINQQQHKRQMKKLQQHYGHKIYEIAPEQKKSLQPSSSQNPFLKNQLIEKQRKQQKQKNYRKVLQEQMEQQKKIKEQEKEKYKQQYNQNFNSYVPATDANIARGKSPDTVVQEIQQPYRKRRDPNGEYPKYEQDRNPRQNSDLGFMRLQVAQLKMKLNKGRISHEEYERDIRKLEQHYGRKVSEIEQQDCKKQPQKQKQDIPLAKQLIRSQNNPAIHEQPSPQQDQYENIPEFRNRQNLNHNNIKFDNNEPYMNYRENCEYPPYTNQSVYNHNHNPYSPPQNSNNSTQNSQIQFQMMLKLFEGLKQIIQLQQKSQQSMLSQKKFLEDTFTKFNPYLYMNTLQMHQMNMNPNQINQLQSLQQQQLHMLQNMMPVNTQSNMQLPNNASTQQVPANLYPKNKEFQTDKKYGNYNNYHKQIGGSASSIHQNPNQSENSISYSYLPSNIDRSLSGIANKIPLTSKQIEADSQNRDIVKFYQKKYRIVPCREFEYFEVEGQPQRKPMPSISNYIQTEDAEQELQELFQADLKVYKRVQKEKELEKIKSKLENSKASSQKESKKIQEHKINKISEQKEKRQQKQQKEQIMKNKNTKKEESSRNTNSQQQANPFLKKHISSNSDYQQIPTFHQDQLPIPMSPIGNSKQIKSSEILQQQQYQTQPRKPSPQRVSYPKPARLSDNSKEHPSYKILKVMKSNDELLNKYMQTPSPYRRESANSIHQSIDRQQSKDRDYSEGLNSISSREYESKEYFESRDISPVQHKQYQSSLQTIRSQEQTSRKSNMDIIMNFPSASGLKNSNFQSIHGSLTSKDYEENNIIKEEKRQESPQPRFTAEYCATVESVEESASKLPTFFHKPPIHRKYNKSSADRKKESVIKVNVQGSIYKSSLSGIPSEGSKQKIDSSLMKPPVYPPIDNISGGQFQSNLYESQYQQSIQQQNKPKVVPEYSQKQQIKNNPEPFVAPQPKWKSLQQARKIARQFRQKSGEDNTRKSVEEKLSQFQSFIHSTKKKQDSILSKRQPSMSGFGDQSVEPHSKSQMQKQINTENKRNSKRNKKNIMDILDGLENQAENQYDMDFQSYREESER